MKWTPDKITALIVVCGCIGLLVTGIDTEVKSILGIAAVYLFGTSLAERRAAKRN